MPEKLGNAYKTRTRISGAVLALSVIGSHDNPIEIMPPKAEPVLAMEFTSSDLIIKRSPRIERTKTSRSKPRKNESKKPSVKEAPHPRFVKFNDEGIPALVFCGSPYYRRWKSIDTDNAELGRTMAKKYGWGGAQWSDLLELWACESSWNQNADGGIPQSKPAKKMASAGDDWETNPETQIKWGLRYIKNRPGYGKPSEALEHFYDYNWY